jgi:predicted DsbA family dithiol-disulfide isomerase
MIHSSSTVPLAYTLSGGVWIVIGVFVIGFVALIFSYFTEKGTEIRFHAWGDQRGDAPGSSGAGNVGKDPTLDVRSWYRGTSPGRHRNVPAPRAAHAPKAGDPELLSRLEAWRSRSSSNALGLSTPPDASRDHMVGPPDAPLQLVEYTDFECPSCQAALRVLDRIRTRLGDELVLVVRHFPVADAHPMAPIAAEAVEAAGAQGRFWDMYRRIYGDRSPPTEDSLRRHAARLKLDVTRFERELRDHIHRQRVLEDFESGLQSGVNGTPTFFVNGVRHDDEHTFDSFLGALEDARSQTVGKLGSR